MKTNILCLETSASKCSVALVRQDESVVYKEAEKSFSHVAQITLLIEACLGEASTSFNELSAVAISGGPGSYTGLRVGTSTAKGICFANDIPLIALGTLSIIADTLTKMESDHDNALYVSIIDARREEVYMAGYNKNLTQVIDNQAYILKKSSFESELLKNGVLIIGGDAVDKAESIIDNRSIIFRKIIPDASQMASLATKAFINKDYVDLSSYTPYYLKPPNITVSKKQFFRKN